MDSPQEQTRPMKIGSMVHCAILEPDKFEKLYRQKPDIDMRTKEGKMVAESIRAVYPGCEIVDKEDYKKALFMRDSVYRNTHAKDLLIGTEKEIVFHWDNQIPMRAKMDATKDNIIVDLKTTHSANENDFAESIVKYGYHTQAACYIDALMTELNCKASAIEYYVIAVENEAPNSVQVKKLKREVLEAGFYGIKTKYKSIPGYLDMIENIKECFTKNEWPDYPDVITKQGLPPWTKNIS